MSCSINTVTVFIAHLLAISRSNSRRRDPRMIHGPCAASINDAFRLACCGLRTRIASHGDIQAVGTRWNLCTCAEDSGTYHTPTLR